ncbi:MAG: MCE family protein [Desulfobacterales bacterium]|uniref:MCE family protein n=1 Tax=Candidatus Desulfatibia vada TaxID=2841696 RepID=A0A8J6TQH7_9BACT|nr:MCE family protein [Candidatus Desulfatibia vada]MBL6972060.1 MCE family protein [Desulfobacterales bacterium]
MELKFDKKEKAVGIFIICIAMLLLTTVIVIGRGKGWFKTYITYYTIFDQSYNLEVNTPVKLFNTDIGKIKQILLVGDKVKIKLSISHEFGSRIRKSTRATVQSPTVLGAEHIAIIPGEDDSPLLQAGGVIPSDKKKSIADYLGEFQVEKTAKMIIMAAQEITSIVQILRDPHGPFFTAFKSLNSLLAQVEKMTSEIDAGKGTVGGLIKSRALLDQVHGNLDEVGKIIGNLSEASAKTPGTADQMKETLETLHEIEKGILESVPDIKRTMKDVEDAVGTLKIILADIEKGSKNIPEVTRSTSQGIQEIRKAVNNIDKVVQSLQQHYFFKPRLPPEPTGRNVDAGLRQ